MGTGRPLAGALLAVLCLAGIAVGCGDGERGSSTSDAKTLTAAENSLVMRTDSAFLEACNAVHTYDPGSDPVRAAKKLSESTGRAARLLEQYIVLLRKKPDAVAPGVDATVRNQAVDQVSLTLDCQTSDGTNPLAFLQERLRAVLDSLP